MSAHFTDISVWSTGISRIESHNVPQEKLSTLRFGRPALNTIDQRLRSNVELGAVPAYKLGVLTK
jgi:hypothetical protein